MANLPKPRVTIPLIGIILTSILYRFTLAQPLANRFLNNTGNMAALFDGVIFLGSFIAFVMAVHLIRKQPGKNFDISKRWLLALFTAPLILAMLWALTETSGYLDLVFDVDFGDVGNSFYFLMTPGIYLFFGFTYFLTVRTKVQQAQTWSYPTLLGSYIVMTLFLCILATVFAVHLPLPTLIQLGLLTIIFIFPFAFLKTEG